MIFGAVVKAVLPMVVKAVLPMVVKAAIAREAGLAAANRIEADVAADPKAVNELSAEKPYQSRVAVGSVVSALGIIVPMIAKTLGYDVDGAYIVEVGAALVTLWGAGYALYGRFKSGLAPLFSRGST